MKFVVQVLIATVFEIPKWFDVWNDPENLDTFLLAN